MSCTQCTFPSSPPSLPCASLACLSPPTSGLCKACPCKLHTLHLSTSLSYPCAPPASPIPPCRFVEGLPPRALALNEQFLSRSSFPGDDESGRLLACWEMFF